MAGKITHALFAEELTNKTNIKNIDIESIKTFSCMPDYPRDKHINRIIHTKKTNLLFTNMFKYIIKNNMQQNTEVRSMFFAFISHYMLDSFIQPYIFYKTFYYDEKFKPSRYNRKHQFYENYIDVYYIEKNKLNKFYKYLLNKNFNKEILLLMDDVIYKTFNIKRSIGSFKKGLIGAKIVNRIRCDKYGIKTKLLNKLNIKYLSYNIDMEKYKYILNLDNNLWLNPNSGEKHYESINQLYKKALDKSIKLLNQVDKCIEENNLNKFKRIIQNNSYITGLDMAKHSSLKYIDKSCDFI